MGVYAYGEAARLLQQAIEVQEVVDPGEHHTRCGLLLALAEALGAGGEPLRAVNDAAEQAFLLAEALADGALASRACQLAFDSLTRYGGIASRRSATGLRWAERAGRYAASGTLARVYAELALGDALLSEVGRPLGQRIAHRWVHLQRALAEARRLGDPQALFQCGVHMLAGATVGYWAEYLGLARELASLPRAGVNAATLGTALEYCAAWFLASGDRARAEELWQEMEDITVRIRDPSLALRPVARVIDRGTLDGELERALEAADRGVALAQEAGSPLRGRLDDAHRGLPARLYLGRAREALDRLLRVREETEQADPISVRLLSALCLAHLGQQDPGAEALEVVREWRTAPPGPETLTVLPLKLLELAVLLRDRDAAGVIMPLLAPLAGLLLTRNRDLSCIGRHLGDAAALLGDREAAKSYYQQGLEVCQKVRFRPEIALIRLGLAQVLLEEAASYQPSAISTPAPAAVGEDRGGLVADKLTADSSMGDKLKAEGLQHLDFAIAEFREMKMQPSLERALKHKGLLTA